MMHVIRKKKQTLNVTEGYTLVELLVTVGVYSLAFAAIAAIFIGYSTAQSRAHMSQRLLNEGNYFFESIAREARISAIDYECGVDYVNDHTQLCLLSSDGKMIKFRFDPTGKKIEVCKQQASINDCITFVQLNPSFVRVQSFAFWVVPSVKPLDAASDVSQLYAQLFQPAVRMTMTVDAGSGRGRQSFDFQTTVSSRIYE